MAHILIINPNSSKVITEGLKASLTDPWVPWEVSFDFYTAPSHAPPAITDTTTAILTASACWEDIRSRGLVDKYDGFLVCCFSDHPLTHILRASLPPGKCATGIFESAIAHALLVSHRFGVISTGATYKHRLYDGVRAHLGGVSEKFVGVEVTGLGVVQLRDWNGTRDDSAEDEDSAIKSEVVEIAMREAASGLVRRGADCILLGCAGMAGMEGIVKDGANAGREGVLGGAEGDITVIDGTKAGVQILAGLVKLQKAPRIEAGSP